MCRHGNRRTAGGTQGAEAQEGDALPPAADEAAPPLPLSGDPEAVPALPEEPEGLEPAPAAPEDEDPPPPPAAPEEPGGEPPPPAAAPEADDPPPPPPLPEAADEAAAAPAAAAADAL